MRALATWCFRHRRLVLLFWLVALASMTMASKAVGTNFSNSFSLPDTESTRALNLSKEINPRASGDVEHIVFQTSGGKTVHDPEVEARISAMLDEVRALPNVTAVQSPYAADGGGAQISRSGPLAGTIAYATVQYDQQPQNVTTKQAQKLVATATSADTDGLRVAVAGQVAEQANPRSIGGTGPGILLALIVLLIVFGSVFAGVLPILSALVSLGTAIGLIGLLSNVMKMPEFSTQLVLLIGLGVGIDYALFIVTRHRQGLMAGWDGENSVVNAVNTSGRAVLFAGIIVCIALLGMFALGVSFLYGMAVSAAIGVGFTMIAALTLLPAMLGFIGHRVMSRRQKKSLATQGPRVVGTGTKGFWPRWAAFESRRPVVAALGALLMVVVIAVPFFSMRMGATDQGNDPLSTTTRQAYDLLAAGFGPGYNGPLQVVVVDHSGDPTATVDRLAAAFAAHPDVAFVAPPGAPVTKDGATLTQMIVFPKSAPQDAATTTLIDDLRSVTIPAAVHGTGVIVLVGGTTAIFADFTHVLSQKLPLFIGLVVGLSFLLLAVVFRSLLIPATAAVMNLLSIGAAFGVIVAVFQHGTLGSIFGVNRPGPIESFLPVMLFAILFGLSMDYEVFLISRIHEEWIKSGDNRTAVRNGLAATGKTITAAALIMILVFVSFIFGGERVIKEFGLGLAAGIFMDAILIRMAIVPAVMFLFGKTNWWFPSWLDRVLPRLSIDPDDVVTGLGPATEPAEETAAAV
ncbi:MAG TPA: MMPL family transporter [Acidimicrobiales bacterium]|nr:MMPL family transporter [Acidimicrobiales bacterium]